CLRCWRRTVPRAPSRHDRLHRRRPRRLRPRCLRRAGPATRPGPAARRAPVPARPRCPDSQRPTLMHLPEPLELPTGYVQRPWTADDLQPLTALDALVFGPDAWSYELFADEYDASTAPE